MLKSFDAQTILFGKLRPYSAKVARHERERFVRIPLPPRDEQEEIAAFLDRKCRLLDENISKRTTLVKRLSEYKKSLIYEVVTGKREVRR